MFNKNKILCFTFCNKNDIQFCEKMFLEITQSSQEKTCAWACNFIKKRLKTPFLQNISGRLLLQQLS